MDDATKVIRELQARIAAMEQEREQEKQQREQEKQQREQEKQQREQQRALELEGVTSARMAAMERELQQLREQQLRGRGGRRRTRAIQRVAEPDVAEPDVAEPDVAEPDVAAPDVAEPDVAEPDDDDDDNDLAEMTTAPPSPGSALPVDGPPAGGGDADAPLGRALVIRLASEERARLSTLHQAAIQRAVVNAMVAWQHAEALVVGGPVELAAVPTEDLQRIRRLNVTLQAELQARRQGIPPQSSRPRRGALGAASATVLRVLQAVLDRAQQVLVRRKRSKRTRTAGRGESRGRTVTARTGRRARRHAASESDVDNESDEALDPASGASRADARLSLPEGRPPKRARTTTDATPAPSEEADSSSDEEDSDVSDNDGDSDSSVTSRDAGDTDAVDLDDVVEDDVLAEEDVPVGATMARTTAGRMLVKGAMVVRAAARARPAEVVMTPELEARFHKAFFELDVVVRVPSGRDINLAPKVKLNAALNMDVDVIKRCVTIPGTHAVMALPQVRHQTRGLATAFCILHSAFPGDSLRRACITHAKSGAEPLLGVTLLPLRAERQDAGDGRAGDRQRRDGREPPLHVVRQGHGVNHRGAVQQDDATAGQLQHRRAAHEHVPGLSGAGGRPGRERQLHGRAHRARGTGECGAVQPLARTAGGAERQQRDDVPG